MQRERMKSNKWCRVSLFIFVVIFAILFEANVRFEFMKFCVWTTFSIHHLLKFRGIWLYESPVLESMFIWIENYAVQNDILSSKNLNEKYNDHIIEIPTISFKHLTSSKFIQMSNNFNIPLVIKAFCTNTKAVKQWNASYLNQYLSNISLPSKYGAYRDCDGFGLYRFGNTDNNKWSNACNTSILFKNWIINEDKNKKRNQQIIYPTLFCNNSNMHKLIRDLEIDKYSNVYMVNWMDFHMGFRGSYTEYHSAPGSNLFMQIHGKKRWFLIDPKYSIYMRPILGYEPYEMSMMSDIQNNVSQYNHIKFIPKYMVFLQPGDALFVPNYWWHFVTNLDNPSIGVSTLNHDISTIQLKKNWLNSLLGIIENGINKLFFNLNEQTVDVKYGCNISKLIYGQL